MRAWALGCVSALWLFACAADEVAPGKAGPSPVWVGLIEKEPLEGARRLGPNDEQELEVTRPGATFLKAHFAYLDLPAGDLMELVDGRGAVVERLGGHPGGVWGLSVEGERLTVRVKTGPAPGARGFLIDELGVGGTVEMTDDGIGSLVQESICGADDKRPVACLSDATSGEQDPGKAQAARAIGRMLFPSGGAMGLCTGSLVSPEGHFLTNNHCIATQSVATGLEVKFNYQEADCAGNGDPNAAATALKGTTFIKTSAALDYTLLKLPESAAQQFGYLEVAPLAEQDVAVGHPIYIVQHPAGFPKKIASRDSQTAGAACTVREANVSVATYKPGANIGYTCDTEGGSSGSPVLSAVSNKLVALHHLGGCNNNGTYMRDIYPEIAAYVPGEDSGSGSGNGEEPPVPSVLTAGVPKSGLSGKTGFDHYALVVPAGATKLVVTTSGGSGDMDLYVRFGAAPDRAVYDFRPFKFGNAETVTVAAPKAGTYFIGLDAYAAYAGLTLSATYSGGKLAAGEPADSWFAAGWWPVSGLAP